MIVRQTATPSAVAAYCAAGHTNAEAAAMFQINERTVRKWKARVASASEVAPKFGASVAQVTVNIPADWIARDGVLWRCGRCGELMPPIPGTTGAEWNDRGCYLHQSQPAGETGNVELDDPAPASDDPDPEAGPAHPEPEKPAGSPAPAPLDLPIGPARPCRPPRKHRIEPAWQTWLEWGQRVDMPTLQLVVGVVVVVLIVTLGRF